MNAKQRFKLIAGGALTVFGGAVTAYFRQDESEWGRLSFLNVILGVAVVGICACAGVHLRDVRQQVLAEATPPREEPIIQPPPPLPVAGQVTDLNFDNPAWTTRVQQERQQVTIHVARA